VSRRFQRRSTEGAPSMRGAALGLAVGVVALVLAAASGAAGDLLAAIASPPAIVRAALAGAFVVVGLRLLGLALARIETVPPLGIAGGEGVSGTAGPPSRPVTNRELGSMLRGIRFVFLAAAAFAAAGGWLLGEALPIVIGVVIAGVDLAETSLLLLVATRPREEPRG
jgi:hypothetical protein